jgi:DNA-binding NarL/FixJ family response regulator
MRIIIVDDHKILRNGLRMLIEKHAGMEVVGEAGTCTDALVLAAHVQPDIILLDLHLGKENSLDFISELRETASKARILILTGVPEPEPHRRALQLGARGLISKDKAIDVLLEAIERVSAGEVWIDPSMIAGVLSEVSRSEFDPEKAKIETLTAREREIVSLICEGLRNKQIAQRLAISEATVRNHITSILNKLGLSDRLEVAVYSYRHGLNKPAR